MSLIPLRSFTTIHPGIYKHRDRLGILQQSGATFVFIALDPDGSVFIDTSFVCPQIAGRTWQSALTDVQHNRFSEDNWKEDYNSFVARIQETVEDRLLDDEEDSRLVWYRHDEDESYIKWRHEGTEKLIYSVVKDSIINFIWYHDDKGLDKALQMLRAVPVDVPLSGVRNWIDFKRVVLLTTLQQSIYQAILDKNT